MITLSIVMINIIKKVKMEEIRNNIYMEEKMKIIFLLI